MPCVVLSPRGTVMAKKADRPSEGKQINFRAPPDLAERLEAVAEALGLDVSNLVRMVLKENLREYERRAKQVEPGFDGEKG